MSLLPVLRLSMDGIKLSFPLDFLFSFLEDHDLLPESFIVSLGRFLYLRGKCKNPLEV